MAERQAGFALSMSSHLRTSTEQQLFRTLNRWVEPAVRAGVGTPVVPGLPGVVVLETVGRRSGLTRRAPLVAQRLGDVVVVSTVRRGRSEWMRNLEAEPKAHVWLGGRRRAATAQVRQLPGLDVAVLRLHDED